jgi:DNA helicase II / ATP-dependent DNA helicase PcrA
MSRLIEQSLAKRQLPYLVVGSGSYYDRMEVKDVLSMLRFVCNPMDGISFHRIANKPARGMGDALIGKLEAFAEKFHLDLLTAMQDASLETIRCESGLTDAALAACRQTREIFGIDTARRSVGDIAQELLDRTQYDRWLQERYEENGEYESRSRNVNELVNSIMDFSRTSPRASIADYLQSISLYTEGDSNSDDNAVRLMSLHASKGLEFDAVYIIGVERGILPHVKAMKDRGERGLEEERRLCYVGFTRARKLLRVAYCQQRQDTFARDRTAQYRPVIPSQFLLESGLLSRGDYESALTDARNASPPSQAKTRKRSSTPSGRSRG